MDNPGREDMCSEDEDVNDVADEVEGTNCGETEQAELDYQVV